MIDFYVDLFLLCKSSVTVRVRYVNQELQISSARKKRELTVYSKEKEKDFIEEGLPEISEFAHHRWRKGGGSGSKTR